MHEFRRFHHSKSAPFLPSSMSLPIRPPSWVSTRRIFEQNLQDLHKCADFSRVKQLHAQIIKQNLHNDHFIAPKLVSAFSLCNQMALALKVFDQIREPNVQLYNTLIRAHVQNSQAVQAFSAFFEMQRNGVLSDNFTYPFLLKACSGHSWLPVVKMIHAHVEKCGFLSDIFVPNALIDTYSRCCMFGVKEAMKLFTVMEMKDTVTWNSMIGGLVRANKLSEARHLFDEAPQRDMITWNTMLDGYVKARDMNSAFELFEKMPGRNIVSWSTMITGYSKAGDMDVARILFDQMPVKNLVTWTIIISGYAEKGLVKEATDMYSDMESIGLELDHTAAVSILAACAESGFLGLGMKVHDSILNTGLERSIYVLNALIDMYAKCGGLEKALDVFNGMQKRDLVSWNAMLQGLATHGQGKKALELFSTMRREGFQPDEVTLVCVLCACNHAGLVDEGANYFWNMERDFGVVPQVEHYGCLVDLLGRAGRLREAVRVVQTMPMEPNIVIWGSLLGACRMHNEPELANQALDCLVRLDPLDPGNYSMLSNIYAAVEDWGRVANLRLKMKNTGVQKPSGASSIELDNKVHEFTVFDRTHPESDQIYQMVSQLVEDLQDVRHETERSEIIVGG